MKTDERLALGVEHYQAGRLREAAGCFVAVLQERPEHSDALHLLGLAMNRMGHTERALELFDRVLVVDPKHAPALANRSMPLRTLGRLGEAEASLYRALQARPRFPQARVMLGQVMLARRDPEAALRAGRDALGDAPDRRDAHEVVGHALLQLGRAERALPHLERAASGGSVGAVLSLAQALLLCGRGTSAVQLLVGVEVNSVPVRLAVAELLVRAAATEQAQPRLESLVAEGVAPARDLLARLLRDGGRCVEALAVLSGTGLTAGQLNTRAGIHALLGRVDEQLADLRSAVALDPHDGAVQHNLAVLLFQSGEPDRALVAHRASLRGATGDRVRCIAVAETLARVSTFDDLHELLLAVLAMDGVDHQLVERALRKSVEADPVVARALRTGVVTPELVVAFDAPLVNGLLRQTRVLGPEWEALLTALRRRMALSGALEGHPELATSIAIQAWHTQYAWWVEPDELAAVSTIGLGDVEQWPRTAAYRGLPAQAPQPASPGALPLWRLMVEQPGRERDLQAEIPVIGLTSDAVSRAVRAQYEQHPYPRLVSVHRKPPIALWSAMRQLLPWFDQVPAPDGPLQVLVAGCGTGQQVLTAGTRYKDAQILAVDLSGASLGVAARLVEGWQLNHVTLAQADILALGSIEQRFHVIECGGVLHHMADPLAGWRVLVDLLAPGGLMKIGLYSEHARVDVVAARELASERGWSDDDEGLRLARREITALGVDHPARAVVWSPDFPSLSGFRDLVMHACEHRFTMQRLGDSLDALGLEFLGFQHPDPRASGRYKASWPDDPQQRDLARWALIEQRHPETFRGMLQFWCRRA